MNPAPHITGATRLYGLVGDPLTTAKSPELLNRLFIERRADAACVPFVVKADGLSAFAAGARAMGNLSGMLVTMPHKQKMLALVDELHPTAREVGALNVIRCTFKPLNVTAENGEMLASSTVTFAFIAELTRGRMTDLSAQLLVPTKYATTSSTTSAPKRKPMRRNQRRGGREPVCVSFAIKCSFENWSRRIRHRGQMSPGT